jgi:hypothetical protein
MMNATPVLEHARHQDISLARRLGRAKVELAWYNDRISDPALTGIGAVTLDSGEFLPDYYAGSFTWVAPNLDTSGVHALLERQLTSNVKATLGYSYGGVLALNEAGLNWTDVRSQIFTERRHALTCKVGGTLRESHTHWSASYKWTSGANTLTPVDLFDTSTDQADPYLGIFIRQPLPSTSFIPGHMEAFLDVRNLLAQGYVPVVGNDGRTLYLVQSARSVRGGVAFTF